MRTNGRPIRIRTCAQHGHLESTRTNVPWNSFTCFAAAEHGHLACFVRVFQETLSLYAPKMVTLLRYVRG